MSSTRGKSSPIRHKRDLYRTPQWCIDLLTEKMPPIPVARVIDLGAGDGRIGRTIAGGLESCPIDMYDVHEPDCPRPGEHWYIGDALVCARENRVNAEAKIVVSNPPFLLATEFVQLGVEIIQASHRPSVAVFLLRVNWLGSKKRAAWINAHPPARITVLAPRPSFTGGGTDSCEYAWIWWTKSHASLAGPPIEVGVRP